MVKRQKPKPKINPQPQRVIIDGEVVVLNHDTRRKLAAKKRNAERKSIQLRERHITKCLVRGFWVTADVPEYVPSNHWSVVVYGTDSDVTCTDRSVWDGK